VDANSQVGSFHGRYGFVARAEFDCHFIRTRERVYDGFQDKLEGRMFFRKKKTLTGLARTCG
jgi:hypothetical protein